MIRPKVKFISNGGPVVRYVPDKETIETSSTSTPTTFVTPSRLPLPSALLPTTSSTTMTVRPGVIEDEVDDAAIETEMASPPSSSASLQDGESLENPGDLAVGVTKNNESFLGSSDVMTDESENDIGQDEVSGEIGLAEVAAQPNADKHGGQQEITFIMPPVPKPGIQSHTMMLNGFSNRPLMFGGGGGAQFIPVSTTVAQTRPKTTVTYPASTQGLPLHTSHGAGAVTNPYQPMYWNFLPTTPVRTRYPSWMYFAPVYPLKPYFYIP